MVIQLNRKNSLRGGIVLLLLLCMYQLSAQDRPYNGIRRIRCSADSSQEFSLFLPADYSPANKYPVLIFLDPVARGHVPVELYSKLAAEKGLVLAGSYNSRNFDPASSDRAFTAIYNELLNRYSIDKRQVWLAGFSGGARAAASIGSVYPEITGVIACGAGFTGTEELTPQKMKAYAAIVGEWDMNYGELLDNTRYLDSLHINNIRLVFDGGHEWPPAIQFELALEWLNGLDTVQKNSLSHSDSFILEWIQKKADSGYLYTAWMEADQQSRIAACAQLAGSLAGTIENRPGFKSDERVFGKTMEQERNYINEFGLAFNKFLFFTDQPEPGKEDWQRLARRVEEWTKNLNHYRQLSGLRCFDLSTRSCLEYYFQLVNDQQFSKASAMMEIYLAFSPANSNAGFLLARAAAGAGNKKQCEKALKMAIKNGLPFNNRVTEDPLLRKLFSTGELNNLFGKKE